MTYTITPRPKERDVLMQREGVGDQLRAMLAAAMERPAPKPLTRRERAACELALAVLRRGAAKRGLSPEGHARADVGLAYGAINIGGMGALRRALDVSPLGRVMRARLALLLRARLRADAGDCGRALCTEGHPWPQGHCTAPDGGPGPAWCFWGVGPGEKAHATRPYSRRITPWWQQPDMPETRR